MFLFFQILFNKIKIYLIRFLIYIKKIKILLFPIIQKTLIYEMYNKNNYLYKINLVKRDGLKIYFTGYCYYITKNNKIDYKTLNKYFIPNNFDEIKVKLTNNIIIFENIKKHKILFDLFYNSAPTNNIGLLIKYYIYNILLIDDIIQEVEFKIDNVNYKILLNNTIEETYKVIYDD